MVTSICSIGFSSASVTLPFMTEKISAFSWSAFAQEMSRSDSAVNMKDLILMFLVLVKIEIAVIHDENTFFTVERCTIPRDVDVDAGLFICSILFRSCKDTVYDVSESLGLNAVYSVT